MVTLEVLSCLKRVSSSVLHLEWGFLRVHPIAVVLERLFITRT
jgi:hypothetical protein